MRPRLPANSLLPDGPGRALEPSTTRATGLDHPDPSCQSQVNRIRRSAGDSALGVGRRFASVRQKRDWSGPARICWITEQDVQLGERVLLGSPDKHALMAAGPVAMSLKVLDSESARQHQSIDFRKNRTRRSEPGLIQPSPQPISSASVKENAAKPSTPCTGRNPDRRQLALLVAFRCLDRDPAQTSSVANEVTEDVAINCQVQTGSQPSVTSRVAPSEDRR
jgi:hypothetical protein